MIAVSGVGCLNGGTCCQRSSAISLAFVCAMLASCVSMIAKSLVFFEHVRAATDSRRL